MFGLAGLGNTVYHPADYALLSQHVPSDAHWPGVFDPHLLPAWLGSAAAPASLLLMQTHVGLARRIYRRGAARLCRRARCCCVPRRATRQRSRQATRSGRTRAGGWRLLLSAPILLNLVFFMLLALISGGMFNYLGRRARRAVRHAGDRRQYRRSPAYLLVCGLRRAGRRPGRQRAAHRAMVLSRRWACSAMVAHDRARSRCSTSASSCCAR